MVRDRYVEIGREVVRLRENLGYSQEELAHRAGVSVKTISRMESPGEEPNETRGSTYRKVAAALGVTVEHLRAPLNRGAQIRVGSPSETLERGLDEAGQDLRRGDEGSGKSKGARGRPQKAAGADRA